MWEGNKKGEKRKGRKKGGKMNKEKKREFAIAVTHEIYEITVQ